MPSKSSRFPTRSILFLDGSCKAIMCSIKERVAIVDNAGGAFANSSKISSVSSKVPRVTAKISRQECPRGIYWQSMPNPSSQALNKHSMDHHFSTHPDTARNDFVCDAHSSLEVS